MKKIRRIILHHSLTKDGATVSWQAIRSYHVGRLGWSDIGYHYGVELVGREYEIFVGRFQDRMGAHTRGHNHDSLGICFVGNFDEIVPPIEQWRRGIKLVRSLLTVHSLPPTRVHAHRDFADKSCPGKFFDLHKFRGEL